MTASSRSKQTGLALLLALGSVGCAGQLPLPLTASQLEARPSGAALVAYLGQPDASPAVCDVRAHGPHVAALTPEQRTALVRSLGDGRVEAGVWRRCVELLLRHGPREDAAALMDAIGGSYRTLLKRAELEQSPALQQRLEAMQRLYLERRNGIDGHPAVLGELFADLRRALAARRLGPTATRFGQKLIAAVDLEQGRWAGRPVDVTVLDGLLAAHDEKTLLLFARRLPAPGLRDEARRRVIRLRIAASFFPEVRDHRAAVEEQVMQHGAYPIALADHPPARAWLDWAKVPIRGVLVRQQVWAQTATLLGFSGERPGVSLLPELALRGALMVEVAGMSRPVTLCGPARELDPTPCIASAEVKLEHPVAYLDRGGVFRFIDAVTMRDALALARTRDRFVLPVSVGGRRLVTVEWRLYYERPEPLVFAGTGAGGDGPSLTVAVDHGDPARFVFTVADGGRRYLAVVERDDVAGFRVVSQGASGAAGADGMSGSSGASGGPCENGGSGGNGSNGGDGGSGSNGGDVRVEVTCGERACDDAVAVLQRV
ncbi:MAG TPA: hypothetical protein VGQ83_27800, partial [Polyangia bacterium]